MNGRMYDAETGRMLQADPVVQALTNLQNYNAYSYVLNNPLSYTDPSGYFFKKLFKGIGKLWQATVGSVLRAIAKIPILNSLVQIGIGVACGPFAAVCTAAYSAAQTYAITGSLGASLRAGAIAYASAWVLKQIGSSDTWGKAGTIENISANAVVGGITSELQGGKFGHGFFAAGFASAAKPYLNSIGGENSADAAIESGNMEGLKTFKVHRIVAAAVIGGTGSVISGGKFANGAVTGAFNQLFNGEESNAQKTRYRNLINKTLKGIDLASKAKNALTIFESGEKIYNAAKSAQFNTDMMNAVNEMTVEELRIFFPEYGHDEAIIRTNLYYKYGNYYKDVAVLGHSIVNLGKDIAIIGLTGALPASIGRTLFLLESAGMEYTIE